MSDQGSLGGQILEGPKEENVKTISNFITLYIYIYIYIYLK